LAAAAAWCAANGPVCIAGGAAVGAIGAAFVNKVGDIIIEYIRQKGGYELLHTKDKLQQCVATKTEMEQLLDKIHKEHQAGQSATLQVGDLGPVFIGNPGWQTQAENLLNQYGGGGIYSGGTVRISEYDILLA
jgi:hypothetical protein